MMTCFFVLLLNIRFTSLLIRRFRERQCYMSVLKKSFYNKIDVKRESVGLQYNAHNNNAEVLPQTVKLECYPAEVFENESVTLVLSFEHPNNNYKSGWAFNGTNFAVVSWNNGLCAVSTFADISVTYEVFCNSTTISLRIRKVQKDVHGLIWRGNLLSQQDYKTIFVKVPVDYVNITLPSGEFRRQLRYVENETATLECISSLSRPQPVIVWFMGKSYSNASVVPSISYNETDGTYNFTRSVITLIVNTANNNKWIFCNSSNVPDVESVSSEYSILDVQYPPSVGHLENSSIIEGKHFIKACPIRDGNPAETNISWTITERTYIISANVNLDIDTISRNQTAQYTCLAKNMMTRSNGSLQDGLARNSFYLNVLYPPEQFSVTCLADNIQNDDIADVLNINEGTNVTLKCNAISNPPPSKYSWSGRMASRESFLTFNVTNNHSGDYTCTASNTLEETSGNTTVVEKSKKYRLNVLYPPQISKMDNITVIEGKSVEFKGNVTPGKPPEMQYYWKRQSDQQVWTTETLSLSFVNRSHESEYIFSVSNVLKPTCGKEVIGYSNKTWFIKVFYPPEALQVTCLTGSSKNDEIVDVFNITEGTNLTLACSANSNPSPSSFSWSGRMATNQSSISFNVTKQHSGDYICTANNSMQEIPGNTTIGTKSKTYRMSVLYKPQILEMDNITVIEGKPVEFKGNVTPGKPPEMQYYWKRRNDQQVWTTETLSISSVNRSQESEYIFSVRNLMKPTCGKEVIGFSNKTWFIKVLYPPESLQVSCLTDSSKNDEIVDVFSITEGTNLTLACSANSNPSPSSFSWSGRMATNQSSITFYVTKQHSGDYTCTANNSMQEIPGDTTIGTKSKTYRMSVLYAPVVNKMPNMTAVEGERLTVYCKVTLGNPSETTFKWIRKSDNRTWNGQTMTIDNITRHDDNSYTCIANNTLQPTYGNTVIGLTSENVNVEIYYKSTIKRFAIEGHSSQNNVTINETDLVTFTCMVESNPSSFMKLTFKDKLLVEKNSTKDLVHVIYKAKCTDWGTYYCFGYNSHNSLQNIPRIYINMYVNCAPRQSSTIYPANNVTNVTSEQHVSSTLTFKALAYPKPNVRWYKKKDSFWDELFSNLSNKMVISSSEDRLEYNLTVLNITQSDYGQYLLNITNCFGQHQQFFNLIPNDKPSPPKQFRVDEQNITESSVMLWWEPGFDGGLHQTFIIGVREESIWKNYTSVEDTDETIMNVTVTGLRSGTQYYFCIYASNQLGSIRFPDEIAVTTKAPEMEPESSSIVGPAAGGTIGGVLAIALIVLALLFVRKRRMQKMSQENKHPHEYQNMSFMKDVKQQKRLPLLPNEDVHDIHDRQTKPVMETHPDKYTTEFKMHQKSKEVKQHPEYENMNLTEDAKHNKRFKLDPIEDSQQMLHNHNEDVAEYPKTRKSKMQQQPSEVKQYREYENMNLTGDAKHRKRLPPIPTDDAYEVPDQQNQGYDVTVAEDQKLELLEIINKISLSDLLSYVTSKTSEDYVHEYMRFPLGIIDSIPYSFARKPQNAPLNRYQGIYPYDHSRVVIPAEPDFFINANYINGHSKKKAYIASLGPTVRHTLGFQTFWKMVWHEKSDVIVMLTNLQEPSGMKCEKYWADHGTTREVGDFTIKSVSEEIAAEYTVRTINVSKKGESRSVTQLHYTVWPDKKVPEDVTSLIEFWQRVKAAPTLSLGPLVVHCSAGIGRTGTYIALDRLYEEGKTTDSVNVFDCVMSMRQQRVNMVQTQDQYVYLHQALVYCLVFDTEPVTADKIEEFVLTTSHNVYIKLFEQLKQSVEVESTYEEEARTRNCDDDERNRTQADIPGDAHRIRLFLDKESDESDYINAVYLNSFKRLGYFIIAQSPLPNTLDDFVLMLYQENCCYIVSLDDYQLKGTNNAAYLPAENQHATYGSCTISSTILDSKSAYTVRKLKIGHSSRGMKIAHHFEYTGWKHDERIPKDVNMFVEFVQEVEEYATQLADEHSHVLVHCLTGSGRSGLFCAVSNLIQKMGQDRQVSVVNTLRQVRARRKTAIRNTEQLKFCYQAVYAFVKNYKV